MSLLYGCSLVCFFSQVLLFSNVLFNMMQIAVTDLRELGGMI